MLTIDTILASLCIIASLTAGILIISALFKPPNDDDY